MISKLKHYHREFLNPENGIAAMELDIKLSIDPENKRYPFFEGDITLTDCNRLVSLDFGVYIEDDANKVSNFEERLQKLDTLIANLQDFREMYIEAADLYKEAVDKVNV